MKAAILQCDRVLEHLQPRFGDYPGMIETMFEDAGHRNIEFDVWDCEQGQYPPDPAVYDFFITTGSKADAWGDEPWVHQLLRFVRQLDQDRRHLIGICFGHQIIARALGGCVERSDKGWGIGIAHNRVFDCPPWMQPCPPQLDLIVSHQDQVTRLPGEDERVLAGSDFCPFFMLQWNDRFLSVQGHPEWQPAYAQALLEERRGVIEEDRIEQALQELQHSTPDNGLFVQWMMAFIGS